MSSLLTDERVIKIRRHAMKALLGISVQMQAEDVSALCLEVERLRAMAAALESELLRSREVLKQIRSSPTWGKLAPIVVKHPNGEDGNTLGNMLVGLFNFGTSWR
jgi:hypothetical protein